MSGKRHLGAALGSKTFTEEYVKDKVKTWTKEITKLAEVAISQPHAAYAAFAHGLSSRWTYLLRTIPDIEDLLLPLESAIHQHLIPALIGRAPCSSLERELLALPVRLGGLGLCNPAKSSSQAFKSSEQITAPLVALIVSRETNCMMNPATTTTLKNIVKKANRLRQNEQAKGIYTQLTPDAMRCVDLAREEGSSSWLSVLPFEEHGFLLHKSEFRDALGMDGSQTTCLKHVTVVQSLRLIMQ